MRKIEYKVVEYEGQIPDESHLNRMGAEGWELVSFGKPKTPSGYTFELPSVMVFKREKEPSEPPDIRHDDVFGDFSPEGRRKRMAELLGELGMTWIEAQNAWHDMWGGPAEPHGQLFENWLMEQVQIRRFGKG